MSSGTRLQIALELGHPVDVRSLLVARSPFMEARQSSAMGAVAAARTAGKKAGELLELIAGAKKDGLADFEIQDITKWPTGTVCSIRNSVRVFLVPSKRRAISPYGVTVVCWRRATAKEVSINRLRFFQERQRSLELEL